MWRFYPLNDAGHDRRAVTFVADALAQAEPDAVILTATDRPTFALWYAVYGLRRRPDLVPLNVNLYGYDWYRATLAGHHPALFQGIAGDAPLETVVLSAAARGPLYSRRAVTGCAAGVGGGAGDRPAGQAASGAVGRYRRPEHEHPE